MILTMEKLQSITIALQKNDLKLTDARVLLDATSELIPGHDDYLGVDGNGVTAVSVKYISVVVSIQNEDTSSLPLEEENLVIDFKIHTIVSEAAGIGTDTDFATDLLMAYKKQKITSKYLHLDWIPPTSKIVERLFHLARLTFMDYRKATLLENLKSILL